MYRDIIHKLLNQEVTAEGLLQLLQALSQEDFVGELARQLQQLAAKTRDYHYGKTVFLRGLIEFSNFCKNNCYYCGIRRDNKLLQRYRLELKEIVTACERGYANGLRTFVLQGGEDSYFTPERMTSIIRTLRAQFPDCALTLSLGEQPSSNYAQYKEAGANRYLLRHETINPQHYSMLHPVEMRLEHRLECIQQLQKLGYQVGVGMMVGSPHQQLENIVEDLMFIYKFRPHMVGVGPFIPHEQTPLAHYPAGNIELTLNILALIRLLLPPVLLPATTALATIDPLGTICGLNAGCNVIMPNISPTSNRHLYQLYNNKKITDGESIEGIQKLTSMLQSHGYTVAVHRGDSLIRNN